MKGRDPRSGKANVKMPLRQQRLFGLVVVSAASLPYLWKPLDYGNTKTLWRRGTKRLEHPKSEAGARISRYISSCVLVHSKRDFDQIKENLPRKEHGFYCASYGKNALFKNARISYPMSQKLDLRRLLKNNDMNCQMKLRSLSFCCVCSNILMYQNQIQNPWAGISNGNREINWANRNLCFEI